MNKLQLYITKSGPDFKSVFNLNPSEDVRRHVTDTANALNAIAYDAREKNIFYMLSSTADGVFFTILRTIPPTPGHHLAAWIYIPGEAIIDGPALERIVNVTTRKVSASEITNGDFAELRELFSAEYPDEKDAPALVPGRRPEYAWRAYGGNTGYTLSDFTGSGLYQQSYLPYAGVLLVDADLGYEVNLKDLTEVPVGEEAIILPPEKTEEGFTANVFGRVLDRPMRGTLGAPLQVTWKRPGFEDVVTEETVNSFEFVPSQVSTENSHKTLTPASFYITSQVTREPLTDCQIRVNGQEITAEGRSFTPEELKSAKVVVSCPGHFTYSGVMDLASTNRALIQLQERRKIYCFELPVISSSLGGPVKFEIQTKKSLTDSPLEGYALLDDIQEGATRTNHLGFVGGGATLAVKLLYAGIGVALGILLMLCVNMCSDSAAEGHLAPAANPDSVVEVQMPPEAQTPAPVAVEEEKPVVAEEPKEEEAPKEEAAPAAPSNAGGMKEAIAYMDDNKVWDRTEMEKNPELKGLYDDMNNFRIDRIKSVWGPKFKDSKAMQKIVHFAEQGAAKKKANLDGTYNKAGDERISVQGYVNRLDP